ncbi:MAG: hypothetical protein AAFR59_01810, partial [Bacteroidota bacterium]
KKGWGKLTPYLTVAASILILLSMYILLNDQPQSRHQFADEVNETPSPLTNATQDQDLAQSDIENLITDEEEEQKPKAPIFNKETRQRYAVRTTRAPRVTEAPITLPAQQMQLVEEPQKKNVELKPLVRKGKIQTAPTDLIKISGRERVDIKPQMPKAAIPGTKNSLDMNKLTVNSTLTFVSNELNKWANSPINIYKEKKENGEIRTFQIKLLDLEITQKTHRKNQKSQKL